MSKENLRKNERGEEEERRKEGEKERSKERIKTEAKNLKHNQHYNTLLEESTHIHTLYTHWTLSTGNTCAVSPINTESWPHYQ